MRRGNFEFSLVMPRARSQRLVSKRSFLTGQQLGSPRVLAVLDKVVFLVPDTYSDCGVTSELRSCLLSLIRSSNLRRGELLTRIKGLAKDVAIAEAIKCVLDLERTMELPSFGRSLSKTANEVGLGYVCVSQLKNAR